jgi:hypothetical protein
MRTQEESFMVFRQLVKDCRQAQKDYFRTKSNEALSRAKLLEAKVDSFLFHYR